jgi:hypothetical protein
MVVSGITVHSGAASNWDPSTRLPNNNKLYAEANAVLLRDLERAESPPPYRCMEVHSPPGHAPPNLPTTSEVVGIWELALGPP